MPEGDTVYLTARRLHAALAGHRLHRGELRHPRWVEHNLAGRTVLAVASIGKHLFLRFDSDLSLHSHLRMDGGWHLYPSGTGAPHPWRRPTHQARVILETEQRVAVGFRLHDLELLATGQEHRLVEHLGPDLLDPHWSPTHTELATRRLTAEPAAQLGLALLDQRRVAGIGNMYKSEICFLLGVSPWAPASDLAEPAEAVTVARRLLLAGVRAGRQSTTGELGRGREFWVYQRGGAPCRRCGSRIRTGLQGDGVYARTAYYCPRCQPGPVPLSPGAAVAGSASRTARQRRPRPR